MDNEKPSKLRFTRIPSNINAKYELKNIKGDCIITDISEGGIRIKTRQIFAIGDMIKITFTIMLTDKRIETIEAWCVVRNVSGGEAGLEFDEISNDKKADLIRYVEHLLINHGKNRFEAIE